MRNSATEPVSAYAVYNSHARLEKNRRRRKRQRDNLEKKIEAISVENIPTKSEPPVNNNSRSDPSKIEKVIDSLENERVATPSHIIGKTSSKSSSDVKETSALEMNGKNCKKRLKSSVSNPDISNLKKQKTQENESQFTSKKSMKNKKLKKKLSKISKKSIPPSVGLQEKHMVLLDEAKKLAKAKISSEQEGKALFSKLIFPHKVDDFMRETWEKKCLYIPRKDDHFKPLISSEMIDKLVRGNVVMYGKHLDVTSYTNGVRETHNPEGRVHAHVMWDYYTNGCSIRLLNPQYFIDELHQMLATLQEYFGCMVGANAYLTPPNSQGFAPHYDDIEAFVIQIEGKKEWKVYEPRNQNEKLPSFSSPNFTDNEIGDPILGVTLEPGDVLYFPRGFIHQAKTVPGHHSLHVTVSTYQKTAWCDLLEKVLPLTLKKAAAESVDFRKGLPIGFLRHAGVGYPKSSRRKELIQNLKTLVSKLQYYLDVDTAVDQMGAKFIHDSLPPVLNSEDLKCAVFEGGITHTSNGTLTNRVQLQLDTKIRLVRAYCCRLVLEDVMVGDTTDRQLRLYHNIDNSREYHAEEPQYLILPEEYCRTIQSLFSSYPSFISVDNLPCDSVEAKINIANDLWERGILMTDEPLKEMNFIPVQEEESVQELSEHPTSETESEATSSGEENYVVETDNIS